MCQSCALPSSPGPSWSSATIFTCLLALKGVSCTLYEENPRPHPLTMENLWEETLLEILRERLCPCFHFWRVGGAGNDNHWLAGGVGALSLVSRAFSGSYCPHLPSRAFRLLIRGWAEPRMSPIIWSKRFASAGTLGSLHRNQREIFLVKMRSGPQVHLELDQMWLSIKLCVTVISSENLKEPNIFH